MKTTQLLAPLRQRRDRLFTQICKGSPHRRDVLQKAVLGEPALFKKAFHAECICDECEDDCECDVGWRSEECEEFYEVCAEIKNLEAKIYDEAMKQQ